MVAQTAPGPDLAPGWRPLSCAASWESTGRSVLSICLRDQGPASQPPPLRSKDPHPHPHHPRMPHHALHTRRNAGLTNFQQSLQYRPGLNPIICWMSLLNLSTPAHTQGRPITAAPAEPGATPAAFPRGSVPRWTAEQYLLRQGYPGT